MKHATSLVMLYIVLSPAIVGLGTDVAEVRSPEPITELVRLARCLRDDQLNDNLDTLKRQAGSETAKVFRSLLATARTSPGCRSQIVRALMKRMDQASKNVMHPYDNYRLFDTGASLLAELKATEALDLLVANIDLTDDYPSGLDDFPALVAIQKIGRPAIPKLQVLLLNDSDPGRRKFAALAIAYIGGTQARTALTSALPRETDPCVRKFLEVSLQAFNNKPKPNHISSELNGKWLSAFYCL